MSGNRYVVREGLKKKEGHYILCEGARSMSRLRALIWAADSERVYGKKARIVKLRRKAKRPHWLAGWWVVVNADGSVGGMLNRPNSERHGLCGGSCWAQLNDKGELP